MHKAVLIITHSRDDETVLPIIRAIEEKGGKAIRFNTDQYPGDSRLTSSYIDGRWQQSLFDGTNYYKMEDIGALWMRRYGKIGLELKEVLEERFLPAAQQEALRAFQNFIHSLECKKVNDLVLQGHFYSKERQLKLAVNQGWRIPESCISNDPQSIKKLLSKYPQGIVAKPLSSYFIDYEEMPKATLFSAIYTAEDLGDLDGLEYSPMIFQEPIEKKLELRVPVVGDKVWAFSIDSQSNDDAKEDWRKEGKNMLEEWKAYDLPKEIEKMVLNYTKALGCIYGSLDIILSPEGEYVFLEINSDGEFFWLDKASNYEIADAFAEELLQN